MKILKKNQIIIYVIAIMLMAAGYLNYTTNQADDTLQTSMQLESQDDMLMANIGDAKLVSSNDVVEENSNETINTNEMENENSVNTSASVSTSNEDYFKTSKLERDTMYSQMIENYEKILNSTNSLETQKQIATEEISKINQTKNSIMICENLIKTKGFDNNVIFVNQDSVSVIIGAEEMSQEEIAQIQNIISRELKAEIENIHIAIK